MAVIDWSLGYGWAPDLAVFRRNDTTIQIGTEAPRRVLITDIPPDGAAVLARLADAPTLAAAISRLGGDEWQWQQLFARLVSAGLLEPLIAADTCPPHLLGEYLMLIHRYGREAAERALAARTDAVVFIEGIGLVADLVGGMLDAAGVGHINHSPGPFAAAPATPFSSDPAAHADLTGRTSKRVRYRRPASQMHPTVTVLAGPHRPTPAQIAGLITRVVPHLPVRVTNSRLVVGPLVLPGRSTCLNCIDRHRTDADPEWPTVSAALPGPQPSVVLAQTAAALAVGQVLDLVDAHRRPASVGATIEQRAGSLFPQRRAWSPHPECQCRRIAGPHPDDLVASTSGGGI